MITPIKIGINASKVNEGGRAGAENYTYNLIKALSQLDHQNRYVLFFKYPFDHQFLVELTSGNPNFKAVLVPNSMSFNQLGLLRAFLQHPVDVFFTAVHTVPLLLGKRPKLVPMIHGLEYKKDRKSKVQILGLNFFAHQTIRKAVKVLVPSTYTKKAILASNWGTADNKIEVVAEGVSEIFYKRSGFEIQKAKNKYGIGAEEYLVSVSTIQPRKNYAKLIEAFALLKKELTNPLKLVICGKTGWDYQDVLESPEKFGVKNDVIFAGRVDDADLPYLLSGAKAFVSTSLEEGFGLPLLEAMACETPCAVSKIDPFVEIAQDFAYYFDPSSAKDIKASLLKLLTAGENNESMVQNAKERTKIYTWEETAKKTLTVLEDIFKNL